MIELPFEKVTTDRFGLIYEPTIPVAIEGPRGSADVFMIIDSGADISLIPFSVGEYIGLDLDITQRRDVRGIGESSVAYILSDVRLRIGDIVHCANSVVLDGRRAVDPRTIGRLPRACHRVQGV